MMSITASVDRVKPIVDAVKSASNEQIQGVLQISQALENIQSITQSTASAAEESAASSVQLQNQAQSMRALVLNLQGMVTADNNLSREGSTSVESKASRSSEFAGGFDLPEKSSNERFGEASTVTWG